MNYPRLPIVEAPPSLADLVWPWAFNGGYQALVQLEEALQPYRGRYVVSGRWVVWLSKESDRHDSVVNLIPAWESLTAEADPSVVGCPDLIPGACPTGPDALPNTARS